MKDQPLMWDHSKSTEIFEVSLYLYLCWETTCYLGQQKFCRIGWPYITDFTVSLFNDSMQSCQEITFRTSLCSSRLSVHSNFSLHCIWFHSDYKDHSRATVFSSAQKYGHPTELLLLHNYIHSESSQCIYSSFDHNFDLVIVHVLCSTYCIANSYCLLNWSSFYPYASIHPNGYFIRKCVAQCLQQLAITW